MMQNLQKYPIAFLLILVFSNNAIAQNTFTKNADGYGIEEKIEINASDINVFELINQHGNITVEGWDKDTIEIQSIINVKSPGPNAAEEILEFISIQRAERGDKLIFRTQFDEEFFSNFPFNIDYSIKVPNRLSLKVKNKLGDTQFHNINGQIQLKQSYGKLHLINSTNQIAHQLELNFVEAKLEKCHHIIGTVSNCTINSSEIVKLKMNSEYSILALQKSQSIDMNSNTDRLNISETDSLKVTGQQILLTCEKLNTYGIIEITKGLLDLSVLSDIKQLSIYNIEANSNITLPSGLSYVINGEVRNGQFSHPNSTKLRLIKEINSISFSGEINESNISECELVLFNTQSDLTIKTL